VLRLDRDRLSWGEEDMLAMSRVLGPESAAKGAAPYLASIVKAAKRKGVVLSKQAAAQLKQERAWRRDLALYRKLIDAPPEDKFEKQFFGHQRADLAYFLKARVRSVLLAHQPGVGKTLSAIMLAVRWGERYRGRALKRVLVVTPNIAKLQWQAELDRWDPLQRPIVIVDGRIEEQVMLATRRDAWVVAHWEALVHARAGFMQRPWDMIIADEAHHMANRKAQRSETLFDLETEFKAALTGHPFANSPEELYSILHWLYPERYSSFWRFWGMHVRAKPKMFGGFEVEGTRQAKLLKWEMLPYTLQRTKREVFPNLPAITRIRRTVELTPKGQREYDKLRRELFVELESHTDVPNVLVIPSVLARITRLRQYVVDPDILGAREKSVKYPALLSQLEDLDGPPVIFTSFREAANRLVTYLHKHKYRRIGLIAGGMANVKRRKLQIDFTKNRLNALVCVTGAVNSALNLGAFGYVMYLDLPWNARDLEQTEGRVDRPVEGTGELVPTTAYRFVVQGTYEERIEQKIVKKHKMFGEVFTVDQIRGLFE
jgi:SNF2 family DNA or RNA helicase